MNRVSDLRPIIKSAVKMLDFSFILFLANRFIKPCQTQDVSQHVRPKYMKKGLLLGSTKRYKYNFL